MSLKKCLRSKNRTQYWRQLGRNSANNQRQKIGKGKLQQRDTKGYQVKFYKLPRALSPNRVSIFFRKEMSIFFRKSPFILFRSFC